MHTRRIASLEVSALGLGCMNMSMGYGACEDDAASISLIRESIDLGCNFLDTATLYGGGHNETLVGRAVAGRRQAVVLASKCGLTREGMDGRPESIARECDASLQKLGTDVIDLYYLHRADPQVPIEESVGALARLVEAGKLREIGLSEVSTATLLRALATWPVAAVQSEYSLWSRTPEHGLLDACEAAGVAFVPFSPLGRQFLTGCARDVTALGEEDLRCTIARPRFEPDAFRRNSELLVPFGAIAARVGCTMAQLALAWLLARPAPRLVPIPGTKHVHWMRENVASADIRLDAQTVAELDALVNEETVIGARYTSERMAASEAEQDRQTRT